jgi:N-acetylated-alpha-linked acidic dipeptidase
MRSLSGLLLAFAICFLNPSRTSAIFSASESAAAPGAIFGFRDSAAENATESRFLAIPDPKKAEEEMRILTQAPHMAGTPEDHAVALYIAQQFRQAGLETSIEPYKVWMNYPAEISVDITAPAGVTMHGPTREHVDGDAYQDDPRVVMPFNGMSPSGDVEAEVVYANYGTPADFQQLKDMNVDVRGKIVIMRYGENFRGVKVYDAQQHGAAGVILYSDPYDTGWRRGDVYPKGPWLPATGVQRGCVGYMFQFPGDPTTPGIASVPDLPQSKRTPPEDSAQLPRIPSTPLSYHDAAPILESLGGPATPRQWQGSLPFTYHVGPGPVRVRMHLKQDYAYRTIWDVIGRIPGTEFPDQSVIVGNHHDAWVYGAVDPHSGTVALLEAVRGAGMLLKSGWRPKRTLIFASWDGEEEGLIGSTEWAEGHEKELAEAAAYFNVDVGVSGPKFEASAVPSLKQFVRDITALVPSPRGGTVYGEWQKASAANKKESPPDDTDTSSLPAASNPAQVPVGDLGSGSDYTVFLQHLGVPSDDIGSSGSYGVYHSTFDDFTWFKKFADPDFLYEQEMARILGLEAIRMADAEVLPYDYAEYGKEVTIYLQNAQKKAAAVLGTQSPDFAAALKSARDFQQAGENILRLQQNVPGDSAQIARINDALLQAERALLLPEGLPGRSWYRHAIYAPGTYTGYAAVVIPGVNEAIDQSDSTQAKQQLVALRAALDRATAVLKKSR